VPAFFQRLGDGAFRATEHTVGPWDPRAQHGGPPAALLAEEMRRHAGAPGLVFARWTFELLGPVPVGELALEVSIARPGRRVQLVEGALAGGGRVAMRARAWQVAPAAAPPTPPVAPPPPPSTEPPWVPAAPWDASGYLRAIEWRHVSGSFEGLGPGAAWSRPRVALVEGEPLSQLARVLLVADSGNGISAVQPLDDWHFINPELTVHVLREPRGEWVCLDARTEIGDGGPGLARSTLWDADGPAAYGVQSLLVAPR
jgi:hypothetical protein